MLEAEFDRFAAEYHDQHARSIRLSGEDLDYFARYKIDDIVRALEGSATPPRRVLDFGAGVGNSLPHAHRAFPDAEIMLLDPSARSLEIAGQRFPGAATLRAFDGLKIPIPTLISISPMRRACSITFLPISTSPCCARYRACLPPAGASFCLSTPL